jgi:hypothetical protein
VRSHLCRQIGVGIDAYYMIDEVDGSVEKDRFKISTHFLRYYVLSVI